MVEGSGHDSHLVSQLAALNSGAMGGGYCIGGVLRDVNGFGLSRPGIPDAPMLPCKFFADTPYGGPLSFFQKVAAEVAQIMSKNPMTNGAPEIAASVIEPLPAAFAMQETSLAQPLHAGYTPSPGRLNVGYEESITL
jgi:hypothetical protein